MTAQLLMTCGLTDKRLPGFVLIRESSGTDASFLVSSILGQQLKASPKIVLVAAHHSFAHYQSVGMRIGYNLSQVRDRGRLKVVDVLQMIYEDDDVLVNETLLELLLKRMLEEVQAVPDAEDCCVILDDVSILRSMTDDDDLVIRFCEQLRLLQEERNVQGKGHLSIVVKLNTYDSYPVIASNLGSRSAVTINVDSLKSGRFREVDGRITICKPSSLEEKVVLYKVNDRNIKTFAKGFV